MTQVTIYGPAQSSYVRTARMVCEEKGVSHRLEAIKFGSDEHVAMHPFAKVPVLAHGDVRIYEVSAIARYLDAAFDGPSLIPEGAEAAAVMETWISNLNAYLYPNIVRDYALQYIFPKGDDGAPDRAAIEAAVPRFKRDLAVLEAQLDGRDYVAGTLSLADLFLAPVLAVMNMFPESKAALGDFPKVSKSFSLIAKRPSFKATAPTPS